MGCYADGWEPVGATLYGDARASSDFGIHLDGRGDYVTIDQTSQRREGATRTYSEDGSFSISFWFWKRECTVAGGFEWLYSHQNNNEDIYNTVRPNAQWTTVPMVINSDEERRAWMASDDSITDMFCL